MQIKGNHVIFEQHEDPDRQRVPPTLIASGRTRWDKELPDGSRVIIREEAHGLGPNVP